jgi:hypothetical protein
VESDQETRLTPLGEQVSEIDFVEGLIVKAPHAKAPDFVKASISIKREELIAWLQKQKGDWVNVDVKEARSGKWYAAVNDFKKDEPKRGGGAGKPQRSTGPTGRDDPFPEDDIPFISNRSKW